MQLTPRGFKKPELTDNADLTVFVGDNMDRTDELLSDILDNGVQIIRLHNSVIVDVTTLTRIPIGIPSYNPNKDILEVQLDNLILDETNYELNVDSISIDLIGWSLNVGDVVNFYVYKNVITDPPVLQSGTQIENGSIPNTKLNPDINIGSLQNLKTNEKSSVIGAINEIQEHITDGIELTELRNTVTITSNMLATLNVPIGIASYNYQKDILKVIYENLHLDPSNYSLNVNHTSIDLVLGFPLNVGRNMYFYVLKNVSAGTPTLTSGSQLEDDSITNTKLATDIKIGSISNLQTKDKSSIVSAINEAVNYPVNNLSRQAIINGNFDVWQRGTSKSNFYTITYPAADRWRIDADVNMFTNLTISRATQLNDTSTPPSSKYYLKITNTVPVSGNTALLSQRIENGTSNLCGANKKVTVSFWARSSIPNKKIGCYLIQGYGSGGSPNQLEEIVGPNFTLTSNWTKYTYSFSTNSLIGKIIGTNNDDYLQLIFAFIYSGQYISKVGATQEEGFGAGDLDIAQVQLCSGETALPFQPKSFADELLACQRYYQKSYRYDILPGTSSLNGYTIENHGASSSGYHVATTFLSTPMRIAPTVLTFDSAGNSNKITTLDALVLRTDNITPSAPVNDISEKSFRIGHNANIAGILYHWTADAEL